LTFLQDNEAFKNTLRQQQLKKQQMKKQQMKKQQQQDDESLTAWDPVAMTAADIGKLDLNAVPVIIKEEPVFNIKQEELEDQKHQVKKVYYLFSFKILTSLNKSETVFLKLKSCWLR